MHRIEIDGRALGSGEPCFIIAEAGVNHNGSIELARRLVDAAREAGADAVKFQTFVSEEVISASAPKADYQRRTTDPAESQLEMVRQLELSPAAHVELRDYCREQGMLFMSTPFDKGSVDLLLELDVPVIKIASGEVTSWPFLEYIARSSKPLILSTGMSYLSEVDEALRVLQEAGCREVVLLHCVSNYPAHPADVNLRAMQTMAAAFGVPVGYSDHTNGITVAAAAVALGACVIEKHLTLDRSLPGPDHSASLEPGEFGAMVEAIRIVESAMGDGIKRPVEAEEDVRAVARRSLAAARDLPGGTLLEADMLRAMRPGTGLSPALLKAVVGRRLRDDIRSGQLLSWSDLL
jgi:N-acetylneuraminate synthase/N,N'-diacetyllegionaminate synthase